MVDFFKPQPKFLLRRIGAVNRRSRLLPPRFSDCSGVNRIETNSINELSNYFFSLGIVSRNWKSDTISTSSGASRRHQSLCGNRVEDFDHRPPNLPLNPHTFREAIFYFIDTAVAKGIIIANINHNGLFFCFYLKVLSVVLESTFEGQQ